MKLKLTKAQFLALYDLLQNMVMAAKPSGIQTRLLHAVLIDVYEKFYRQAFNKDKKKYSVNLADHEACAWWMFFNQYQVPAEMVFETTLVVKINNEIHQKFAA